MPELTEKQLEIRREHIRHAVATWTTVHSILKRLAALGPEVNEGGSAILGLLALYEFHEGDISEGFAPNYLARFVFNLLEEIAWEGVGAIANDPEQIRKDLDEEITNMKADVRHAHDTVNRYADLLKELKAAEKEEAAVPAEAR
jgi:hypothetical protein